MGFRDLLRMMIEKDGSDLFLTTGAPPSMKAHGKLIPELGRRKPVAQALDAIAKHMAPPPKSSGPVKKKRRRRFRWK